MIAFKPVNGKCPFCLQRSTLHQWDSTKYSWFGWAKHRLSECGI